MTITSNAPRPIRIAEERKVVNKKSKKDKSSIVDKDILTPLAEDELIEKIIKGEG